MFLGEGASQLNFTLNARCTVITDFCKLKNAESLLLTGRHFFAVAARHMSHVTIIETWEIDLSNTHSLILICTFTYEIFDHEIGSFFFNHPV